MLVRKVQTIKAVEDLFEEGTIFIEYGDKTVQRTMGKGLFYREDNKNPGGTGLSIDTIAAKYKFENYFKELDPIPFKDTAWFKIVGPQLKAEYQSIEESIAAFEARKAELAPLIALFKEKEETA